MMLHTALLTVTSAAKTTSVVGESGETGPSGLAGPLAARVAEAMEVGGAAYAVEGLETAGEAAETAGTVVVATNCGSNTRGKKISIQHMLGDWRGFIPGCHCPACRDVNLGKPESEVKTKVDKKSQVVPPLPLQVTVLKRAHQQPVGNALVTNQSTLTTPVMLQCPNTATLGNLTTLASPYTFRSSVTPANPYTVGNTRSSSQIKIAKLTHSTDNWSVNNSACMANVKEEIKVTVEETGNDCDLSNIEEFQNTNGTKRTCEEANVSEPPNKRLCDESFLSLIKEEQEFLQTNGNVGDELNIIDEECMEMSSVDIMEVFDKTVGSNVTKMFRKIDNDPLNYVECTVCFKKIKENSMRQHFRTHAGLKPHCCDICGSRFTRKGDVYRHKRVVHKKWKPFVCRKCNKTFPDRSLLMGHLQNHDKAIYYGCETCGYKFGKKEYYESHIRYIHPLTNGSMPIFEKDDEVETQLQELEEECSTYFSRSSVGKSSSGIDARRKSDLSGEEQVDTDMNDETADDVTDKEDGYDDNDDEDEENVVTEEDEGLVDELETVNNDSCDNIKNYHKKISTEEKPRTTTVPSVQLRTVSKGDSKDEDLVNKILDAAVAQATSTLQNLAETTHHEQKHKSTDTAKVSSLKLYKNKPMEIIINASVGGEMRRFIIQVEAQSMFDLQSESGMELIVNMVNQLCAGKGELDGPIEVVLHDPATAVRSETGDTN